MKMFLFSLLALIFGGLSAALAQDKAPVLAWPVDCSLGMTCWIQQYPDHDASTGAADFACGSASYDGHDGVDIRLRNILDRAVVKAAAAGVVKGARDGMADHLVRTDQDRAAVKERECGNGVVLDHGDGWETQYCHMRQGSVQVRPGARVAQGEALGEVGFSGDAAFPHLHLSVRKDGEKIDPFSGPLANACESSDHALWAATIEADASTGDLIQVGFAPGPIEMAALEEGWQPEVQANADPPALVAYMWAINLRKGDRIDVALLSGKTKLAEKTVTLDRNKAQSMLFAGRWRPPEGWPASVEAHVVVTRDGREVLTQRASLALR